MKEYSYCKTTYFIQCMVWKLYKPDALSLQIKSRTCCFIEEKGPIGLAFSEKRSVSLEMSYIIYILQHSSVHILS